jgi:beta-galactosidase
VTALGAELEGLADLAGAQTASDVAIVLDWQSWWALELDSRPSTLMSMVRILRAWYEPLWRRGYSVDFAHPESDLSAYRLVLVPQLYSVTDHGAQRIVDAAESGSTVAVGYFSGAVDEQDRVRSGGYPAPWTDLLGIWVEEYRPLLPDESVDLQSADGRRARASEWTEHVHAESADIVFSYVGGDVDGCPAVTRRSLAGGAAAWYVSAGLDRSTLDALLLRIADESGAKPILVAAPPADVEVAMRQTDQKRFLFLLNHGSTAATVSLEDGTECAWSRVHDGTPVADSITVDAGDVVVLSTARERKVDPA